MSKFRVVKARKPSVPTRICVLVGGSATYQGTMMEEISVPSLNLVFTEVQKLSTGTRSPERTAPAFVEKKKMREPNEHITVGALTSNWSVLQARFCRRSSPRRAMAPTKTSKIPPAGFLLSFSWPAKARYRSQLLYSTQTGPGLRLTGVWRGGVCRPCRWLKPDLCRSRQSRDSLFPIFQVRHLSSSSTQRKVSTARWMPFAL